MGLEDFDASAQPYPSIARIYPELHAYVRESVERVKDVDAKFFVLKLLVFFNDMEKRQGLWQGLDGLIFAHRSTCEELPAVYHQLSDTAKAELFAAFELTDLVEWIRERMPALSHPIPTLTERFRPETERALFRLHPSALRPGPPGHAR